MLKFPSLFTIATLLLALPLFAAVDSVTVYKSDPIVVTGTRLAQQKSTIPAALSVVTQDELQQFGDGNLLPALQRHVPGLVVGKHGSMGYGVGPQSGGALGLRGLSGSPNTQVLVLIDGQPQFMGIFGHPISDSYMAGDAKRVEVLRGPASVLYGANAFGGAINIISRPATGGFKGSVKSSYGSFNAFRLRAESSYATEKASFLLTAAKASTDGHREDANDSFRSETVYFKSSYKILPQIRMKLDGRILDARYNHPGATGLTDSGERRDFLRGRAAFSFENTHGFLQGAAKLFYNWGNHDFSGGFNSSDFTRGLTLYQNFTMQNGIQLTAGAEYKEYGGRPDDRSVPDMVKSGLGLGRDYLIDEWAVYGMTKKSFGSVALQAGYRFIENSEFGDQHVPAAGFTWQADSQTTLRAITAKGYRSPTVNDLFLFPPSNAALAPEKLWSYETGIRRDFFNRRASFEITFFLIEAENMVQLQAQLQGPPQRANSGAFTHRGVELSANLYFSNRLYGYLNYAFLDREKNLIYSSRHKTSAGLSWQTPLLTVGFSVNSVFDFVKSETPVLFEDYSEVDVFAHKTIAGNWKISAAVENLLDEIHEMDRGYPVAGRVLRMGLEYTW